MTIKNIHIGGIWKGAANIHWMDIDPKVNILVGDNGSGKSTLLNALRFLLMGGTKELKEVAHTVEVEFDKGTATFDGSVIKRTKDILPLKTCYVNTFDIPSAKKNAQSQLTQQLDALLYQRQKGMYSFTDYRLDIVSNHAGVSQSRIKSLFALIDNLFSITGKKIEIKQNEIVFNKKGVLLTIDQLSSGEKQMLILLFTVFLMKQKPAILLLDEPEISLHMAWQDKLIEYLLEINPNCQILLTTHSPNIFADGWGDKLVFMEEILK